MRKVWVAAAAGFLLAGFFSLALAEEGQTKMDPRGMMGGSGMGGSGMMSAPEGPMGQGSMDMGRMMGMGCSMMKGSMVATQDGGVIVLMGNKLQKYDKNLTLKKEVEIEADMGPRYKMMGPSMMGPNMGSGAAETAQGNTQ